MDLTKTSNTVVVSRVAGAVGPLDPLLTNAVVEAFGPDLSEYVHAWQLLPRERVRVTFKTAAAVAAFVSTFESRFMIVRDFVYKTVVIKYLPAELSSEAVRGVLAAYGEVISHKHCVSRGVLNGTREVKMKLRQHLPSHIFVCNYRGLVGYDHQPRTCFVCGSRNHVRAYCPNRVLTTNASSDSSYASVVGRQEPAYSNTKPPDTFVFGDTHAELPPPSMDTSFMASVPSFDIDTPLSSSPDSVADTPPSSPDSVVDTPPSPSPDSVVTVSDPATVSPSTPSRPSGPVVLDPVTIPSATSSSEIAPDTAPLQPRSTSSTFVLDDLVDSGPGKTFSYGWCEVLPPTPDHLAAVRSATSLN